MVGANESRRPRPPGETHASWSRGRFRSAAMSLGCARRRSGGRRTPTGALSRLGCPRFSLARTGLRLIEGERHLGSRLDPPHHHRPEIGPIVYGAFRRSRLQVDPPADYPKRFVPIDLMRPHQIGNGAVHIGPAPSPQPPEEPEVPGIGIHRFLWLSFPGHRPLTLPPPGKWPRCPRQRSARGRENHGLPA